MNPLLEKLKKFFWEGENKWISILFVVSLLFSLINYILYKGENLFFNFLSAFFTGLTVSSFFEKQTRKELFEKTSKLFKKYIREVAFPYDEDIKMTLFNYFQYLNTRALPYEEKRVIIFKILNINVEDNIIKFKIILKFKFNITFFEKENIKRTFTLSIPKYVLSQVGCHNKDIKELRKTFFDSCNLASEKVDIENVIITEEEQIKEVDDIIIYFVPFTIPLTKKLDKDEFHLELALNYFAPTTDYFIITFNTYCKEFHLEIDINEEVDKELLLTIKPDPQNKHPLIGKCHPSSISFRKELNCRNILPGSKFIIDWKRKKEKK